MKCRIKEKTHSYVFSCVFFTACIVVFKHNAKVWNLCCSDLNRYNVDLKIKASHTHVFPPRNEPKRMYNAISPFVDFLVLTIMHILVLGGQKPPCYYFLWKCIENSTEFLVYVFEQVSCLKLMICFLMVFPMHSTIYFLFTLLYKYSHCCWKCVVFNISSSSHKNLNI